MYGTSCLSIPFDTMNKHYLSEPRKWSTKKLPKFMFYFGPTSSIFDIITFALLFFIVCPQSIGSTYAGATASQKLLFSAIFCTGWFIESLWTQEMVIRALRDSRLPFIKQQARRFNIAFKELTEMYNFNNFKGSGHSNGGLIYMTFLENYYFEYCSRYSN